MESKNMIHTGCCDLCGDQNASVAPLGNDMVCRVCNPDNWARVADEEKSAWLLGQLDDHAEKESVWAKPGHSQR